MSALRALLQGTIDYAGLFPPAGLGMAEAVANYAAYRAGSDAWALGRFVFPAARAGEFRGEAGRHTDAAGWPLAVLIGADPGADLAALGAAGIATDTVEGKADSADGVTRLIEAIPPRTQAYVEIPIHRDPAPLIAAIGRAGGRAKLRTGGVTADAFPAAGDLVRFIRGCLDAGVPFKATAGLHHPLRAEYRLTYQPDSQCGTMFGFLNLHLATALMADGLDDADAELLLEERDRAAIGFDGAGAEWRGRRVDLAGITEARERGIVSFGSCSFTEPVGDLRSLGLL